MNYLKDFHSVKIFMNAVMYNKVVSSVTLDQRGHNENTFSLVGTVHICNPAVAGGLPRV